MGYNKNTGIVTAPLNINAGGDIQQAVGYNSGDLGQCILRGVINKWAKWKPEISAKAAPLTEAERRANNYGLTRTKFTSFAALAAGFASQWVYNRPTVINTTTSRPRMFDFTNAGGITSTGYNKNAKCFFDHGGFPTSYVNDNSLGEAVFYAYWNKGNNLPAGSLAVTDFFLASASDASMSMGNMYFGLVLYDTWSEVYYIVTSATTVAADMASAAYSMVRIYATASSNTPKLPSGVNGHHFICYPVLSYRSYATALATSLTDANDFLVALPASPFGLDIISAASSVQLTVEDVAAYLGTAALLFVHFKVGMVSSGGGATTISDCYYRVYGVSADQSTSTSQELTSGGTYLGGTIDSTVPTKIEKDERYRPNPMPSWVWIHIYRSSDPTIYRDVWVQVSELE